MSTGFRFLERGAPEGDRRRFRVEVPAASPFFAGHFPGRPILPGIAHLAIVAEAGPHPSIPSSASPGEGENQEWHSLRNLRLRRPVHPGDILDLLLDHPAAGGTVRFELKCAEAPASQGSLQIAPPVPLPALLPDATLPASDRFPDPATLVPHAFPALLVRRVLDASAESASCLAEIPEDSPFAAAGQAPVFVGLEAAAQAAAVLEALERQDPASGPRIGYLVSVREARFHVPYLPVGRVFRARVRLTGSVPPLAVYEVRLDLGGFELLSGTISTYVAEPS